MRVDRNKKNEQGFTLIEILIAITITAIIMTAVFIFFDLGFSTWQRADQNNDLGQNYRVLETTLKKDLHQLFYNPLYANNRFSGNFQELTFLTIKDEELQEVSYAIDYYSQTLTRTNTLVESIKGVGATPGQEREYFNGLKRIDFSYYDGRNNYWKNNWDYQEQRYLPAVVKLSLKFAEEQLPPLEVEIFVDRSY